jgi:putative glutathione S-transferase
MVEVASGKVATNAYRELEYDLATQWKAHHRDGAPDLFPADRLDEIESVSDGIFHDVNNGVYKCGFAGTQAAYDKAFHALFGRLDELSDRLAGRRYLVGDTITEADVRLFVTLVRFDAAYHGHFKCNRHKLTEMPVLWAYARDLFQTPGFGDTIDFEQIKQHYYGVHVSVNPSGIVPLGPDVSGWLTSHGREELGGRPFGDGTPPPPPPESERVPSIG